MNQRIVIRRVVVSVCAGLSSCLFSMVVSISQDTCEARSSDRIVDSVSDLNCATQESCEMQVRDILGYVICQFTKGVSYEPHKESLVDCFAVHPGEC